MVFFLYIVPSGAREPLLPFAERDIIVLLSPAGFAGNLSLLDMFVFFFRGLKQMDIERCKLRVDLFHGGQLQVDLGRWGAGMVILASLDQGT